MSGFLSSMFGLADKEHPHPNGSKVEDNGPVQQPSGVTPLGEALVRKLTPFGPIKDAMDKANRGVK